MTPPEIEAALAALDREPSREHAAELLRCLAVADVDDGTIRRLLAHAANRVMSALATRASIRFEPPRVGELFCRWPVAVRAGFEIWLPTVPLWSGKCPRCDHALSVGHDSYGLPTYTRTYRCTGCGWRDEQPTDEETLATLYSRMHDDKAADRVAAIRAQPVAGDCWPLRGLPFEDADPLPALAAIKYRSVSDVRIRNEQVDHVTIGAEGFLAHGAELLAKAPIRSVTLLDAGSHVTAILSSPLIGTLVGLAMVVGDDRTRLLDALITAPARPCLRHLRFEGVWLRLADLEVLVSTRIAESLSCFHAALTNVMDSVGEDYISFSRINDDGRAALTLADEHRYLEPTVEDLRKEQLPR